MRNSLSAKEFNKKNDEFKHWLAKKKNAYHRPSMILTGDFIIYERGASFCVIVILYDKEKSRATAVHLGGPYMVKKKLELIIKKMRSLGSKNITAILAGGGMGDKDDPDELGNQIWGKAMEILEDNKIPIFKNNDIKNQYISLIALWLESGDVKYFSHGFQKDFAYGEFKVK